MENYKKMYCILFNAITKSIEILQDAQKKAETLYINACYDGEETFDGRFFDKKIDC